METLESHRCKGHLTVCVPPCCCVCNALLGALCKKTIEVSTVAAVHCRRNVGGDLASSGFQLYIVQSREPKQFELSD
jgi:hypothetical protein